MPIPQKQGDPHYKQAQAIATSICIIIIICIVGYIASYFIYPVISNIFTF